MKRNLILAFSLALAPALRAEGPADDVKAAAKKLAEAANYTWTSSSPAPEGSQRGGLSLEGKTEKDGCAVLKTTMGDTTRESVIKAGKVAVKTEEGWKSGDELAAAPRPENGGGGGGGRGFRGAFAARMAQTFKAPAADAEALAAGVKELKKDGDTISGDLTEEAAKDRLTFGGRRRGGDNNGGGTAPTGAKGTVKFWIKDGVLAKYEVSVEGKFEINGESRDMKRTTITEIKDVGSTKLEIADEAKAKLAAAKPAEESKPESK